MWTVECRFKGKTSIRNILLDNEAMPTVCLSVDENRLIHVRNTKTAREA